MISCTRPPHVGFAAQIRGFPPHTGFSDKFGQLAQFSDALKHGAQPSAVEGQRKQPPFQSALSRDPDYRAFSFAPSTPADPGPCSLTQERSGGSGNGWLRFNSTDFPV